jgi:hypothetical protein
MTHHVLEHVVDIDAFLSASSSHLKSGGYLLIQVPGVIRNDPKILCKIFLPRSHDHIRGYSEVFFKKIHKKYNFEIIELKITPCNLSELPSTEVNPARNSSIWGDKPCGISVLFKKK